MSQPFVTGAEARVPGWSARTIRDFQGQVLVHVEAASAPEVDDLAARIIECLKPPENRDAARPQPSSPPAHSGGRSQEPSHA